MEKYMTGPCDNIYCNDKQKDGTCGALDYDGDRTEWCQTRRQYKKDTSIEKVKIINGIVMVGDFMCGDLDTLESLYVDIGFPFAVG